MFGHDNTFVFAIGGIGLIIQGFIVNEPLVVYFGIGLCLIWYCIIRFGLNLTIGEQEEYITTIK